MKERGGKTRLLPWYMPVLLWQAVLCWPWLDTSHSWSLSVPPLLSWAGGSAPLQAAGKSLLWCWNTSSFSFFTDLGICWAVSFMYFLLSLLLPVVQVGFSYPFLKGTTTMADGSVVGPSWSPMSLAPSDTVGISGSFPQKPPPAALQLPKPRCANPKHKPGNI